MEYLEINNLLDFSSMCRICMTTTENATNIFLNQFQMRVLSDIIMECAPIQIENNDQLPQSICRTCLEKVQNSFNFRTLCIETDQKLREILTKTCNVKDEVKDEFLESVQEEKPVVRRTSTRIKEKNETSTNISVESIKSEEIIAESDRDDAESDPDDANDHQSSPDESTEGTESPVKPAETYRNYPRDEFGLVHCKYCDDYFKGIRTLKRHVKSCLRQQEKLKESLKNDIEKKIVFPSKVIIKNYGPNKLDIKMDDEGFFICPECGKKYSNKYKLRRHWREHNMTKLKCPECDRSFVRLSHLREHIRIHTKETFCTCEFCGKCFRHKNALHKHRKIHLGIKPYTCTECNRSFTQNKSLKNHMRTHTGERPFVCEICGKDFNRRHILKTHVMTHTGERRFECNICQKKFICKQHLTLHTAKHNVVIENVKNDI